MNRSVLYAVLVGSLLFGVGLGRCAPKALDSRVDESVHISLTAPLPAFKDMAFAKEDDARAAGFVVVSGDNATAILEETTKLEEYTPPAGFLHRAGSVTKGAWSWINPLGKGFATKVVAYQVAFPYGAIVTDGLIKTLGFGFSFVNPVAAAVFVTTATTLNHTATVFPGGEAVRGLLLAPFIEPLVKPTAQAAYWLGEQVFSAASAAWTYCQTPSEKRTPETTVAA